uniref:ABC-type transporter phomO n=1 Tax=Diaporthe leptostromiformis TaxID=291059 RepID=PHOO1_DIALO|nr:RecName: Full=ABC-type transporter phomO; AltName: Full=Phomopsin biosynthesis cluster protein O [Diaporthe leptostromiformis]BDA39144.1 ABC transporter [Diaporthe leptostromiformis]
MASSAPSSSSCTFQAESSFGPAVASCRRAFDFTLYFEEVVFVLVPSCVFILLAATRLLFILRRARRFTTATAATTTSTDTSSSHSCGNAAQNQHTPIGHGLAHHHILQQCTAGLLVTLHVAGLILLCTTVPSRQRTDLSVPASVVAALAFGVVPVLAHFEHKRRRPSSGPRSSSLLVGLFLCVAVLLRAPLVRTHAALYGSGSALVAVEIASLVLQLVLIAVGEVSSWAADATSNFSPEESAGFLGRSFGSWLWGTFVTGYRTTLSLDSLVPIDSSLESRIVATSFDHILPVSPSGKPGKNGQYRLLLALFRSLGLYALAPVIPRLCLAGFTLAQPFLASATINYIGNGPAPDRDGYGLIGATFLIYTGIAVSTGWYWSLSYKNVTKIRGGLVDGVSQKMLRLSQQHGTESKVLTMMINDVYRITSTLAYAHELWVAPIETAIGTWMLCRHVGPPGLVVLGIIGVCLGASTYVGKHMAIQQGVWLAAVERRIGATKKMLASIKAIKMMGAGPSVAEALERLRRLEFAASRKFRALIVGTLLSSYSTATLAPVLVFGTYIGATTAAADFSASTLFTSLIWISLLASPLIQLLQIIPSFGAALGSLERIDAFFEKQEFTDERDEATAVDSSCSEKGEKKKEHVSLSIHNSSFSYTDDSEDSILKDVNLVINRGQHVVVTGPAGCGKSLLLQAILGEVAPQNSGSRVCVDGKVAFCSQTPWLENLSARQVVSRFSRDKDPSWTDRVVDACELREFLEAQDPDATIGSQGSALARAIQSRPDILLLDDVLSPIDYVTKKRILRQLFGKSGILHETGTTVFQVTQDHAVAQLADIVLRLDETGALRPYQFPPSQADVEDENGDVDNGAENTRPRESSHTTEAQSGPPEPKSKPTEITDRKVYATYFESIGFLNLVLFIGGGIIFAFCLKFPNVWVGWWTADSSDPDEASHNIGYWFGIYAMLNVLPLIAVAGWVAQLMMLIVPLSGSKLHRKLVDTVSKATFSFISRVDTGSLLNRFNQDLMFVDSRLPLDLFNTAAALLTGIAQVILIGVSAVYVLASIPVLAAVLFLLQHFYLRTSKQLRHLDLQSKAELHTRLSESYQGLATIRAARWQRQVHAEFQAGLDRSQAPVYLLWTVQTWLKLVLNLVVAGLALVVMGAAVGLHQHGSSSGASASASGIGIAFLNLTTLGETMTNLLTAWTSLETTLGAIARMVSFSRDTPAERDVLVRPDSLDHGGGGGGDRAEPPESWPESGGIKLEGVWATYDDDDESDENTDDSGGRPATDVAADGEKHEATTITTTSSTMTTTRYALQDISLEVRPGERVAVCGRTGSGKSTLLLALLGLVAVRRGRISIDGRDVAGVPRARLRGAVHVIPQDPFISVASGNGETIREALDPAGKLGDEEVTDVLQDCGVLDKIVGAGGLAASVSDEALSLSAGERQLFVLARLICRAGGRCRHGGGGILLLDEATSSLDVNTDGKTAEVLRKWLPNMTVLSVLHRLEAALKYDRVVVLEGGRVAHVVTPSESTVSSDIFAFFGRSRSFLESRETGGVSWLE